jgi:hypothetical protein
MEETGVPGENHQPVASEEELKKNSKRKLLNVYFIRYEMSCDIHVPCCHKHTYTIQHYVIKFVSDLRQVFFNSSS